MNLENLLADLQVTVLPGALLRDHTTFKLGGPCRAMLVCTNTHQLVATVRALRGSATPFILIGFGSNILASDHGLDCVVIRYSTDTPVITAVNGLVRTDACTQFDDLAAFAAENGLTGMEKFSGIPGTVGGAIVGNAGAYGQQVSDCLTDITVLRADNSVQTLPKDRICFKYRNSDLKRNGLIVLSAGFRLTEGGDKKEMSAGRLRLIAERESKHGRWQESPCAGSFFQNVLPSSSAGRRESAGWFLEQCGCREINLAGAHSYRNHANILTRDEGTAAQSVYDLSRIMSDKVREKFGFDLVREVRLLGRFQTTEPHDNTGFW